MGIGEGYQSAALGRRMADQVADEIAHLVRHGLHPTHRAALDAVARVPGERLTLLDVGCGAGLYCAVLRGDERVVYEGADFNATLIERARRAFPGTTFHEADARELPFDDGSFDVVLAGAMLEHIAEWEKALGELCRVARGHLILHRTLLTIGGAPTRIEEEGAFGTAVWRVYLNLADLAGELGSHDFHFVGAGTLIAYADRTAEGYKGEQWTFLCERAA